MPAYKVLVLDDNRLDREVLRRTLVDAGFDAETVADIESFEKALTWWKPSSVVVDAAMRGESGVEIARRVKDLFPAIPIVLTCAMPKDSLERLRIECGAEECLSTLEGYTGVVDCLYAVYEQGASLSLEDDA